VLEQQLQQVTLVTVDWCLVLAVPRLPVWLPLWPVLVTAVRSLMSHASSTTPVASASAHPACNSIHQAAAVLAAALLG
jgi:hypothetical protein